MTPRGKPRLKPKKYKKNRKPVEKTKMEKPGNSRQQNPGHTQTPRGGVPRVGSWYIIGTPYFISRILGK